MSSPEGIHGARLWQSGAKNPSLTGIGCKILNITNRAPEAPSANGAELAAGRYKISAECKEGRSLRS